MKTVKTLVIIPVMILCGTLLCSCAGNPQKAKAKYLANGQNYMKKQQYASAAIEFRNALKIDPRFVDAYYQLAQADFAQQEWRGAYASLEKAIELDPNRMDARLDRGRLFLATRDFKRAEEDADFVLTHDPNNAGAYQLSGSTLIAQQKAEQALTAFSKVAELSPNDASAYINMALVEVSLHRLPDAEQHFQRALQLDPKSVTANIDLANFYHLQGKLPEAQKVLQTAILASPDSPQLYIDWASMLSSAGKTADADGVLDRLRNQMPKSTDAAMAIAGYYAQRNNLEKALVEYRRGLTVSPNNLEIEKRLEELYLDSGQTEQATQMDAQLSKQAPKDVFVRINHGRLLMVQGKSQDAVGDLQKTVKDAADSAQAHYYLGMAYWQNGSLPQANSELQEALHRSPGLPIALQGLTKLSLAQGDAAGAQTYALELVQKFPSDVNNRLLLGGVYARQAQYRLAEEQFMAAKQLAPSQAAVHVDIGQLYALQTKWTEAEKEFQTAEQLDSSNTTILGQYVDFLVARQQLPKAIALIQQFVNNNPNNALGHGMLGHLQFQAKNNGTARAEFERAIQLDSKQVQAYLGLARIYQAENQTDTAIGQYQKALELQPKSAFLMTMIGNLYIDRDLEIARKYFQRALDVDPNFTVALANMAWVDALEGKDLDVALGMAQKAKSQMPELVSITDTLAWVMYKKGNYSGAVPLLEEAVKKAPNSAEFHYHLGMTLIAAGQKDKGRNQLQAALEMKELKDADAAQARQALTQVN
jgi:cellulose synthase operon protein C